MTTRNRWFLLIILLIALGSIAVRVLINYRFDDSALLYVGIPFLIAIVLTIFTNKTATTDWRWRYVNILRDSMIVLLASSVVLFEGFLCVAMFIPIYLIMLALAFLVEYLYRTYKDSRGGKFIHVLPALILLSSLEGTHEQLSFPRHSEVTVSRVVPLQIAQIKANLAKPIDLQKDRPWFLELFPMPHRVEAGSLSPGDVHIVHYRYHRWFVTNTHEGSLHLQIAEVGKDFVTTRVLKDDSYIAKYLHLHGTRIQFIPLADAQTEIQLTLYYDRKLDPAWYFGPLERYGVGVAAEFLIQEIMLRDPRNQDQSL